MAARASEVITLKTHDNIFLDAVRRGHELVVELPQPGEIVYKTLGEYAIYQPDGEPWQFHPARQWLDMQHSGNSPSSGQWETAETIRTRAGEGTFLADQMDLLETALVRDQRIAKRWNTLAVASEIELEDLLHEHRVPMNNPSLHDLYNYIRRDKGPELENITLHNVNGELWLATAQTMLNVYHEAPGGSTQRLRETWKTHYDDRGNAQSPVKSTIRSSMGETGHLIDGQPERPYDTARRGLREELGIVDDSDIMQITSTSSLLRQKARGHHRFKNLKAEDHTHYFTVWLNPKKVRPEYINEERDADGRLAASILLEWSTIHADEVR